MTFKTQCQHCGGDIEYDEFMDGAESDCPHCRRGTILEQKKKMATENSGAMDNPTKALLNLQMSRIKILQFCQLLILALIAALSTIALFYWHPWQAKPMPRYEYSSFEFTRPITHEEITGYKYQTMLQFVDLKNPLNPADDIKSEPEFAGSADYILDRLGNDGWNLAGIHGDTYIVKRPEGKWLHDYFRIFEQVDTNSVYH